MSFKKPRRRLPFEGSYVILNTTHAGEHPEFGKIIGVIVYRTTRYNDLVKSFKRLLKAENLADPTESKLLACVVRGMGLVPKSNFIVYEDIDHLEIWNIDRKTFVHRHVCTLLEG